MATSVNHIVTFGRTGAGKSWCCNKLTKPGQPVFKEDDGDESCTTSISSHIAFNGDLVSDVPGYFDSHNRDAIQQANFVDFLKNKPIRVILFLYTDRADSFMMHAIDAFKVSGLHANIIFIKNKVLTAPPVEVDTLDGCTKISVMANQTNLDVLKSYINKMVPVVANRLLTPVSLFKSPLEIVRHEMVEEYVADQVIPETVKMSKEEVVYVQKIEKSGAIRGFVGAFLGIDGAHVVSVPETRTISYDQVVQKPCKVFNKVKYTYARRFDGACDIYKKEVQETLTKRL